MPDKRPFPGTFCCILVISLLLASCNPTAVPQAALGSPRMLLAGHTDWVTAMAVTPDGGRAISGSRDMTIKVWDLAAGRLQYSLAGHRDGISSLAVSPDGRSLASGSWD